MPNRRSVIPAHLTDGSFTAAQAGAAGVGRGALSGPTVRRLARGLYVADSRPKLAFPEVVAAARPLLPPDALVTGVTALRLLGIEVGRARPLCFCTTSSAHTTRKGLRLIRVKHRPPAQGASVGPEHAFLTASADLDLKQLVTAGDWLVRLKLTSPARLLAYAEQGTGRGCRTARRAAALVRARVDSPKESELRLMLVLAGLPEPACNQGIGTAEWFIGHGDLVYEIYRVVLEYEGDHHRLDKAQWDSDIGRFEQFVEQGWNAMRITARGFRTPRTLVLRVEAALRAGGYDGPAPVFTEEWCRLFE